MTLITKQSALQGVALGMLLVLSGCGGQADPQGLVSTNNNDPQAKNSPAPSVTTSTAKDEASAALGLIGTLDGAPSGNLTSQEAAAEFQTVAELLTASVGTQAVTTTTFFCSSPATATTPAGSVDTGNGSVTTVRDDVDPAGPSTGDKVTVTFDACVRFGRTINGTRSFEYVAVTGQPFVTTPWTLSTTRSNNETIAYAARTVVMSGTSSVVADSPDATIVNRKVTGTSTQTTTPTAGAAVTRTRTFTISTTRNAATQTFTTSANVSSTGPGGSNAIETTTPITGSLGFFTPPTAGVIKITNTSTTVPPVTRITTITILAGGQAQLDVDSNGDGIIDTTTTVPWTGLFGLGGVGLNFGFATF